MKHRFLSRICALGLALSLLIPTGRALTVEQAGSLLKTYYVDVVPEEVLSQDAVQEMLKVLGDPYTVYFTAEEYAAFNSSMQDSQVVGIGISATWTQSGMVVQWVFPGGSAQEAGLEPGDVITAIDGRPLADQSLETATEWLRGEAGTQVAITYLRTGVEKTLHLTRRKVVVPATVTQVLDRHVGLIRCDAFGGETVDHFAAGIRENRDRVDRWIVDLRANGGGMIQAATEALGMFTGKGMQGYLRDRSGSLEAYETWDTAKTTAPLVVLTSEDTASAAEIFAAAVRDRDAGICVGERTYGKGVAQVVTDQRSHPDWFEAGDAMKITAYRFFAPGGSTTDMVGVIPHLLVPAQSAEDVAELLCARAPSGDTAGMLQLDLGESWYIDLDQALADPLDFALLLEAIPNTGVLLEGTGGPDGWRETTPRQVAAVHGLDYQERGFSDTDGTAYGAEIDLLATYGIVAGDGTGAFRPESGLTRAQLCVLLARALNCRMPRQMNYFSDVPANAWYAAAVNAAVENGLMDGVGGGRFAPDAPVSHEQLVTVLGRLARRLNLYFCNLEGEEAGAEQMGGWAPWARHQVWLLAKSQETEQGETINLLWGEPGSIVPAAAATRGETACLLYNLFAYCEILPA